MFIILLSSLMNPPPVAGRAELEVVTSRDARGRHERRFTQSRCIGTLARGRPQLIFRRDTEAMGGFSRCENLAEKRVGRALWIGRSVRERDPCRIFRRIGCIDYSIVMG